MKAAEARVTPDVLPEKLTRREWGAIIGILSLGIGVLTFSGSGAAPIPVPGAIVLFLSAIGALGLRRRAV